MLKQTQYARITVTEPGRLIGNPGHFAIFLSALFTILWPPVARQIAPTIFMMGALVVMYPFALRRLMSARWLIILGSLFLINVFFGAKDESPELMILGYQLASSAVFNGVLMTLRAVVILMAADGLSNSVSIVEVAGLFERCGLRGLGFSIGIATNLLPDLRHSSLTAWHGLRMRGGFRAQWRRGVQLLMLTIISNALRHAEEIVLASEVRAFRPELSQKVTIRSGILDWWIIVALCVFLAIASIL